MGLHETRSLTAVILSIEEFINEIYNEAATLCKAHHQRLHSIYGKRPKLVTALKQKRWVDKQREKHGMV